jgi:hypothetical protein
MSTLTVGTIQSNTTSPPTINNSGGTQIGTFCRAWVNFNGTGTVAIRASFNVSSVSDLGVGTYDVNFVTAMPDINYVTICPTTDNGVVRTAVSQAFGNSTTGKTQITVVSGVTNTLVDASNINVSVFR